MAKRVKRKKGGVVCPKCGLGGTHCTDSRPIRGGTVTMRRRHCFKCHERFTTYERAASPENPPDRSFIERVRIAATAAQVAFARLSEMQMILAEIEDESTFDHRTEFAKENAK